MWIEILPRLSGLAALLIGVILLADAVTPDRPPPVERRRSPRAPRNRLGQGSFALGVLVLGAALAAGESWGGATAAVIAALALLTLGVVLDARHLSGLLAGSAGRAPAPESAPRPPEPPPEPPPDRATGGGRQEQRRRRGGPSNDDPLPWPLGSDD